MPNDLLDAALRLLDAKFSVIPVRASKKGAAFIKWAPYQKARPTQEQVTAWFSKYHDGLAIVTGAVSNAVVLDMDVKSEHDGRQIVRSVYGWEPEGPQVRTGGGGLHAYYSHPGHPVQNVVGLHPGVDIRGDGGFVYAPPSPHPSGKRYEWIVSPWDEPLPPLPTWLVKALNSPVQTTTTSVRDIPIEVLVEGVQAGIRNEAAARIAGWCLSNGQNEATMRTFLSGWNLRNPEPLPEDELKKVADSIVRRDAINRGGPIRVESGNDRQVILQGLTERFAVQIEEIERIGGAQPFFRFKSGESTVEVSAEKIGTQTGFRTAFIRDANTAPNTIGRKANPPWDHYLRLMLKVAKPIDPGEEATVAGEVKAWVTSYLEAYRQFLGGQEESPDPNDPCMRDGKVYLHVVTFRRFVENEFGGKLEHKAFCQRLRAEGFEGGKKMMLRLTDGKRLCRMMWQVPAKFVVVAEDEGSR